MNTLSGDCHLTYVADTTAPGCDLVRQWLREFNWSVNPDFMEKFHQAEHEARPLVILASASGETIGGLFAETQLSWLRISIMAVSPGHRSQGIGSRMLAEAEQEALRRHCQYSYVDTMEYQAPGFYLAHGYELAGILPDWDSHGHAKKFFIKHLRP